MGAAAPLFLPRKRFPGRHARRSGPLLGKVNKGARFVRQGLFLGVAQDLVDAPCDHLHLKPGRTDSSQETPVQEKNA